MGVQKVALSDRPDAWNYAATALGIVITTTAVTIKAAVAEQRNYITDLQIQTAMPGGATEAAFCDGAAGTVFFSMQLQTPAPPLTTINFQTSLKGSINALLGVVALAGVTGGFYVNTQGFVAT